MGRLIAIGDIHGCAWEFEALLDRVSPVFGDRIVLLGDLVNRGPESPRVIRIARELGARCLLGNHEHKLLMARSRPGSVILDPDYQRTFAMLGEEEFAFMDRMQPTHLDPVSGILCVHGGFMPGVPWDLQSVEVVTRIQVLDKDGMPATRAQCPYGRMWASSWKGPEFVLYGHTPGRQVRRHRRALGIDTACVRGGALTAYIHPDDKCVHVRARRSYT
jgi:diadenosine tetraphosphatase ApaH/serine/threonine PP2A family protein phosphatase